MLKRGLIADKSYLISKLKSVSYYRLSGYFFQYQDKKTDRFYKGTKFKTVWKLYIFDRQLRILILDAIERFEVSIKTNIAYFFSKNHDPFSYLNLENLPKMSIKDYSQWVATISRESSRSKEEFIKPFFNKYPNHISLPIWMAIGIISFGSCLNFYKGISIPLKRKISRKYDIPYVVMISWMISINSIRNISAHHSRLINRNLIFSPTILNKNKYPEWHEVTINNRKLFSILTILKYLMNKIAPESGWKYRLKKLINDDKYDVDLSLLGFPKNWEKSKLWNDIL